MSFGMLINSTWIRHMDVSVIDIKMALTQYLEI